MQKLSGIYKIENLINGHIYIGQTVDLKRRKNAHFSELKRNKHKNIHLQNAFNLYGEKIFVFKIILYCEREELTYYEQYLVDILNPEYNINRICVDSRLGFVMSEENRLALSKRAQEKTGSKNPMYGKHHSEESRKKISKGHTGLRHTEQSKIKMSKSRSGKNNAFFGKKHDEKTREKMRKPHYSNRGVNHPRFKDKETVVEIKNMINSGLTISAVMKILKVSDKTIHKVMDGFYMNIYGV